MNELLTTLLEYVPRILGALAILAVGLVLALVARRAASFVLERIRFDRACARVGLDSLLRGGGVEATPSQLAGKAVFWAVLFSAALAAMGPLGLEFLSAALEQILLYAPRVAAALLIVTVGVSAAGFVGELTESRLSRVGVRRTGAIRSVVTFAVIFVSAVLAAAVLEIDVAILIALTIIGFGTVGLTAALALGLGLRELSRNVTASRYVSDTVSEGDRISINGVSGTAVSLGHSAATIETDDGRSYVIPNAHFLEHIVEKSPPEPGE